MAEAMSLNPFSKSFALGVPFVGLLSASFSRAEAVPARGVCVAASLSWEDSEETGTAGVAGVAGGSGGGGGGGCG